jgi:hypothetical protein
LLQDSLKDCNPSEQLAYIRSFGLNYQLTEQDLIETIKTIPDILLWSPVLALDYIVNDFYNNGYGTTFMESYFKDNTKIAKLIKAGKQTSFDKPCLMSLLVVSDEKQHMIMKYADQDLTDKFATSNVNKWVDIMIEYGFTKKMTGIDYEFQKYVVGLSKLTKFWDVYKSQNINSNFVGNQFIMMGGSSDNNDLFKIYEGNYELVPTISNPKFDDKDACKLICDWDSFNKLTPSKQNSVKAYLLQNINIINNFIQRGSEKVYAKLLKAKNTQNYNSILHKYIKPQSYYNSASIDGIYQLQQTLNTRMNASKFKTVADAMEFIVHQYIPLLKNYRKSSQFNKYTNTILNNSDVLSVIGVAEYINNDNDVKIKYIEKPIVEYRDRIVEKPIVEYRDRIVEKPIVEYRDRIIMRGGGDNEPKQHKYSSTELYVNELIKLQQEFNSKYCSNWRSIVDKLKLITTDSITKDEGFNVNVIYLIRKVLVTSPKTTYYISGLLKTKNINKQYHETVVDLINTIVENKVSSCQNIIDNLKSIAALCESSRIKIKEIRNKYINSGTNPLDQLSFSMSKLKIENDITLTEVRELEDICTRIERMVIEGKSNAPKMTTNQEMLKNYISKRNDKNKIIDQYFDSITQNLNYSLNNMGYDFGEKDQNEYEEAKQIITMRIVLNNEMKKGYKWLNSVYDVMLSKNRLEQMRNKTLSPEVLRKIERAYLDFNSYNRSAELERLKDKFINYTSTPNKFKSYFKIAKLAKKCIENVNLLGYVERLYKELGIINPEFNWNVFKENMISFLVNNMIRVDVFIKTAENKYVLTPTPLNNEEMKIDIESNRATAIAGFPNVNIAKNDEIKLSIDNLKNRRLWLKSSCSMDETNPKGTIQKLNAQKFNDDNKNFITYQEALATSFDSKLLTYGYSLRKEYYEYYPVIKNLPIATVQSLYTPIVEILNKYLEQRYQQTPDLRDASITKLMYGGNKIEAGSIFDVIDPKAYHNNEIIPEATEYYISAYYIIKYYYSIIEKITNGTHDKKTNDYIRPKLKFFKISPLVELNEVFDKNGNLSGNIKPLVHVLNDYWDSFNDSNIKTKINKAIDMMISEINSSIMYGSSEEIESFKDGIFNGDMDFNMFRFEQLNNTIERTLGSVKDYLVTIGISSFASLEKYFEKYTNIIKNASPSDRINILQNILLNSDTQEFNNYNNFCETCITPLIMILKYYSDIFGSLVVSSSSIALENRFNGITKNVANIKQFFNKYVDENYTTIDKDEHKFVNEIELERLLIIYYQFVLNYHNKNNKYNDEKNSALVSFVEYIFNEFKNDVEKSILLLMNYPGQSDQTVSLLKNNLLKHYETITNESIKKLISSDLDLIKKLNEKIMEKNCQFIPTLNSKFAKIVLKKRLIDPKYPFLPKYIIESKITKYSKGEEADDSFTKFVTIILASQHPDFYLPQTYATLLENSQLYGITCSDIGNSIFSADMIRGSKEAKPTLDLYADFGPTPMTNICLYISKSENAISKTTSNLMNSYYATNLISIIPVLLSALKRFMMLLPDNFNYKPALKNFSTSFIDAKVEISVLSEILIKLYNEILPISNNIQFMDHLNTNVNHTFTELMATLNLKTIGFSESTLSFLEWINPIINVEVGLNYDTYDRFQNYNNTYLKPLMDNNFKNKHDDVKRVLAKIFNNSLISSINLKENTKIITNYNTITKSIMGGDSNTLEDIVKKISMNPQVLRLAGKYGFNEKIIYELFSHLYGIVKNNEVEKLKNVFNKIEFPSPLHDAGIKYHEIDFSNADVTIDNGFIKRLHDLRNNEHNEIKEIYEQLNEILRCVGFSNSNSDYVDLIINSISSKVTTIDDLNKRIALKDKNNNLLLLALIFTITGTINFQQVIEKTYSSDKCVYNEKDVNLYKYGPTFKSFMPIANIRTLLNNINNGNTKTSLYQTNDETLTAFNIDNVISVLCGGGVNKNNVTNDQLNNIKLEKYNELNASSSANKIIREYVAMIAWNEVSFTLLNQRFKTGFDFYYHLFINTILIIAHINQGDNYAKKSLNAIFNCLVCDDKNNIDGFERYISSLLSCLGTLQITYKTNDPKTSTINISQMNGTVNAEIKGIQHNLLSILGSNTNIAKNLYSSNYDKLFEKIDKIKKTFYSNYITYLCGDKHSDIKLSLTIDTFMDKLNKLHDYNICCLPFYNVDTDIKFYDENIQLNSEAGDITVKQYFKLCDANLATLTAFNITGIFKKQIYDLVKQADGNVSVLNQILINTDFNSIVFKDGDYQNNKIKSSLVDLSGTGGTIYKNNKTSESLFAINKQSDKINVSGGAIIENDSNCKETVKFEKNNEFNMGQYINITRNLDADLLLNNVTYARIKYLYEIHKEKIDPYCKEWNFVTTVVHNSKFVDDNSIDEYIQIINNNKLDEGRPNTLYYTNGANADKSKFLYWSNHINTTRTLINNNCAISLFPILGKHRLLYRIESTLCHKTGTIDDAVTCQQLYMSVFEENNKSYLCAVVGRRVNIEFNYTNLTMGILALRHAGNNIISSTKTGNNGDVNNTPYVTCHNIMIYRMGKKSTKMIYPFAEDNVTKISAISNGADSEIKECVNDASDGTKIIAINGAKKDDKSIVIEQAKIIDLYITDLIADRNNKISTAGVKTINYNFDNYTYVINLLQNLSIFCIPLQLLNKPINFINQAKLDVYRQVNLMSLKCVNDGKTDVEDNEISADLNRMFIYNFKDDLFKSLFKICTNEMPNVKIINAETSLPIAIKNNKLNCSSIRKTLDEIIKDIEYFEKIDSLYNNLNHVTDFGSSQISPHYVDNLSTIPMYAIGNILGITIYDKDTIDDNNLSIIKSMNANHDILNKITKSITLDENEAKIVYNIGYTNLDFNNGLNSLLTKNQIFINTETAKDEYSKLKELLLISSNSGINDFKKIYETNFNGNSFNMFGGDTFNQSTSYSNPVSSCVSYATYNLNTLVTSFYRDKEGQDIFKNLMPFNSNVNDVEKMIITKYNKSMLTLTPLFDRYLFMEILYNSNVLKQFVKTMLNNVLKINSTTDPTTVQNKTLLYLYNAFSIDNKENYYKYYNADGENTNNPYDKEYMLNRIIKDTIFHNNKYSPSSVASAIKVFNKFYDDNKDNTGLADSIKTISVEILNIDKFNVFIGTLCKVIKSISYYSTRDEGYIQYANGSAYDPIAPAELK